VLPSTRLWAVGDVKGHVKGKAAVLHGLEFYDRHARLANDLQGGGGRQAGAAKM